MIINELIARINEDADLTLEWRETDIETNKQTSLFYSKLFDSYRKDPKDAFLMLGLMSRQIRVSPSIFYLYQIANVFIRACLEDPDIEVQREHFQVTYKEEVFSSLKEACPLIENMEIVDEDWIKRFLKNIEDAYKSKISLFEGTVEEFFHSYNPNLHIVGKVFFHLVENKKDGLPFAFLATYAHGVTITGKSKHLPLGKALLEFKDNPKKFMKLFATVMEASKKSEWIAKLIESKEIFHPIYLDEKDAYTFLKEIPIYESCAILCRIPNWWVRKRKGKISIQIDENKQTSLNAEAVFDLNIKMVLGGEEITLEELRRLKEMDEGLHLIRGNWVEVNHEKLDELLNTYETILKKNKYGNMGLLEAMKLQVEPNSLMDEDEGVEVSIENGSFLNSLISSMSKPDILTNYSPGKDFNANLRHYQQLGLNWLIYMKTLKVGACLADDMGLGKTIQVIALLNHTKEAKLPYKTLIVVPASLIGNWVHEISVFANSLEVYVIHASSNSLDECNNQNIFKEHNVFITTYSMLKRIDWLFMKTWDYVIIDEAQAIKNPNTKQTRAVKKLDGNFKLALTGTPIENRLSDLWSLFDFLNKGLLGSKTKFGEFVKSCSVDPTKYVNLKKVVMPFILRRLKTDKKIIKDLPDKIEVKKYAMLSKKQAMIYLKLVDEAKNIMAGVEPGIKRQGVVLSLMIKLKQVCNHPSSYTQDMRYRKEDSGKFALLEEICQTIYEKRECVLIFTQFREIIEPLEAFLTTIFHRQGLVIHGKTSVKKRQKIVDEFQSKEYVPFLILSLKAGGVGLNLTKANHVIHFDRWWNPAVENQATDRAFRIGQKKNVVVHKLMTKGTIEEKIDLMIEEKKTLANEVISSSNENIIANMSNEELFELLKLD